MRESWIRLRKILNYKCEVSVSFDTKPVVFPVTQQYKMPDLEMEAKFSTKTDDQLNSNITWQKNDKKMFTGCSDMSCLHQRKNGQLPLKFGYFYFSVSFSAFLTACWLSNIIFSEPSRTLLWIDRSGPRFQICAGGWKRKTYKSNVNFGLFCEFPDKSDSKFLRPDPESERLDI